MLFDFKNIGIYIEIVLHVTDELERGSRADAE